VPALVAVLGTTKLLRTALRQRDTPHGQAAVIILLWLFVPVAIVLAVSLARPLLIGRYLIVVLPAYVLLFAEGLAWLRPRPLVP
jgi:hypothetical protein